jgi:formamidopyrimidine-DNA glycosylase
MPELPEVEITARRLSTSLGGAEVESALAPGVATLKTFEPSLDALTGARIEGVRRIGKMLAVDFATADGAGPLTLLIHLMSAGRLQLFGKRASLKDRRSRLLIRIAGGRELRLREFGTKQAAWAKLLRTGEVEEDEALATLGPEAWPDPPPFGPLLGGQPRPLHSLLRDQRTIAGIGRSWVDEILWEARLSPFKRGADLAAEEADALRAATVERLGDAIDRYAATLSLPLPDRLPLPLKVHRHEGQPCPRCGATLEAVHFEDYVIAYCPVCQTEGRVLKDRRLSRLLR